AAVEAAALVDRVEQHLGAGAHLVRVVGRRAGVAGDVADDDVAGGGGRLALYRGCLRKYRGKSDDGYRRRQKKCQLVEFHFSASLRTLFDVFGRDSREVNTRRIGKTPLVD